jgi:hypothetical protein
VLQVDADERVRVQDPMAFRRFLATALADADGFDVPLRDIASDGSELGGQQLPRIFRGGATVFEGRVHEVAQLTNGRPIAWAVTTDLELEHHGYRPEVIAARDKKARNLRLARQDHEMAPSSITRLQLSRSLPGGDERLALLEKMHADIKAGDASLNEAGMVPVYNQLAHDLAFAGRDGEAWEVISDARTQFPHVPVIRATYAEMGTRLGRHSDVAAAADEPIPGEGARPWADTRSEIIALIETAKSQLAVDAIEAAAATSRTLLAIRIPDMIGRWTEIASITALCLPDDALDLLLPHAARDESAACLTAVAELLSPEDAAQFAGRCISLASPPSPDQRTTAWQFVLTADLPESFDNLIEVLGEQDDLLADVVTAAGPRLTSHLRMRDSGITASALTQLQDRVSALILRLQDGEEIDVEEVAMAVAADPTGAALRRLAAEIDPPRAAPIAARAVNAANAARAPQADIQLALILCTLADDAEAATVMRDAAASLSREALGLLRRRATDKGAPAMAAYLTNMLITHTG